MPLPHSSYVAILHLQKLPGDFKTVELDCLSCAVLHVQTLQSICCLPFFTCRCLPVESLVGPDCSSTSLHNAPVEYYTLGRPCPNCFPMPSFADASWGLCCQARPLSPLTPGHPHRRLEREGSAPPGPFLGSSSARSWVCRQEGPPKTPGWKPCKSTWPTFWPSRTNEGASCRGACNRWRCR